MQYVLLAIPCLLPFLFEANGQSTYDARVVGQVGIDYACDGMAHPSLKIRNEGTSPMIGCVVETWKNGVFDNSFNWELAVSALSGQSRTPQFPPIDAVEGDEIELRIISVNGVADEVEDGNTFTYTVQPHPVEVAEVLVVVEVLTDEQPEEISWAIRDDSYQAVATSPSYSEAGATIGTPVHLLPDACYWFEVMDAFGNGIGSGGHVKLTCQGADIVSVLGGGEFELLGDGFTTSGDNAMSERSFGEVLIAPVPASDHILITSTEHLGRVDLYDLEGRMIAHWSGLGTTTFRIPVGYLRSGQYVLRTTDWEGVAHFRRALVAH